MRIVSTEGYTTGHFNENDTKVVTLENNTIYTIVTEFNILTGRSSTRVFRQDFAGDHQYRSTLREYKKEVGQ